MTNSAAVALYLDAVKLEPLRNGNALLRRKPGTTRLETGLDAGKLSLLCNIEVRKNRITSETVSVTGAWRAANAAARAARRRLRSNLHRLEPRALPLPACGRGRTAIRARGTLGIRGNCNSC